MNYQLDFMMSYVRRVNAETLNVTIGGVRIGSAKYSRLAQINLKSRIITFSRYAIQNVPEKGRRYLVLHELAHVLEPSHNKRFWSIVAQHEPDYKRVDQELIRAFRANVRAAELTGEVETGAIVYTPEMDLDGSSSDDPDIGWTEDEDGSWVATDSGIMCGGA